MGRKPRVELAGGIHHVITKGNRALPIFEDEEDYAAFEDELAAAVDEYGWTGISQCSLPNHIHFVVETHEPTLGLGMGQVLSRYTKRYNRRRGIKGRMYGRRFWSNLITTDEYFAQALRYVALNPVKAGLCRDAADWRWSSHGLLIRGMETPLAAVGRIDDLLGVWGGESGGRYAGLFGPEAPWGAWADPPDPYREAPPIADILAAHPTDEAMRRARWEFGYRIADIASAVGLSTTTVWRRTQP